VNDRGSIVVGWLARLVILFSVLGFLAYDGVTLMVANFGAADDAGVAASAAADTFARTNDVRAAYDSAVKALDGKADTVETKTFSIDSAGKVTLLVDRHPTTFWVHRVGPLKKWTLVRQNGSGTPAG
jgi:hypothetical protein